MNIITQNEFTPPVIKIFLVASLLLCGTLRAMSQTEWRPAKVNTTASLRGLSIVNKNVIWASGTKGTFLRSTDGGATWKVGTVAGAEDLDFRDVEAFDEQTAYLLSIGNGASSRIYKTDDGGATWQLQFKNENPDAFFDALAFWDSAHGIAMSDPVGGKYLLIKTDDGGATWRPLDNDKMPPAITGEAAFAASGTCLVARGGTDVFLVSGGQAARVFRSANRGLSWLVSDTPIIKGTAGSGIFSLAMRDNNNGVIVGGNYEKPDEAQDNFAFTTDGGKTWKPARGLTGYRSGVAYVNAKIIVAVGSSGSDITFDGGKNWRKLDAENYNAVQAKGKNAIWAVGAGGRVARLILR